MSNSKKRHNSTECISDAILGRLLDDKQFRKTFFKNRQSDIERFGVTLDQETRAFLEKRVCPQVSKDVARFDEKLVLCSSAPD